jgi:hypothetical protein
MDSMEVLCRLSRSTIEQNAVATPDIAGARAVGSSACRRDCSGVLGIFGVPCGGWPRKKYGVLSKMVGHGGCWLGLCPRDPGIRDHDSRSRQNEQSQFDFCQISPIGLAPRLWANSNGELLLHRDRLRVGDQALRALFFVQRPDGAYGGSSNEALTL